MDKSHHNSGDPKSFFHIEFGRAAQNGAAELKVDQGDGINCNEEVPQDVLSPDLENFSSTFSDLLNPMLSAIPFDG